MSEDFFESIAEKLKLSEDEKRVAAALVLLNPGLLVSQFPNSKALASAAEDLLKNGNSIVAENRYATAAKLALYEGDAASAKSYLEKVVSLDKGSSFGVVLSNFSDLSRFVDEFYKSSTGRVSS